MKYDLYLRGYFWRMVDEPHPVAALNAAYAVLGDVSNGRVACILSCARGQEVTDAVQASKGVDNVS